MGFYFHLIGSVGVEISPVEKSQKSEKNILAQMGSVTRK